MKPTTLEDYRERILRVLVYIQQHLDENTPLEDLARVAAFSPFHFHRVFRGMVGESVKEHVRRLRLERAVSRLKFTDTSIIQLALEAGYESHEAFTRAFKSLHGVAPSEFRSRRAPRTVPGDDVDLFQRAREGEATMEAKIKSMGPLRLAFVRHTGPYAECGKAWETLCTHLGRQGLLGADTQHVGLCYDDPEVTAPEHVRYDACCTVGEEVQPEGAVGIQTLEAGEFAVATHFGPFEKLSETYAQLMGQWIPQQGRELSSGPCVEIYLTDPENTDPEDYVTDVHVPLEPGKA